MHRPTQRRDALRERVIAGRQQRSASRRRATAARKGGRRVVAIGAGLAMVAGVLTVTQLASSALEDGSAGLGAACEPTTVVIEEVTSEDDLELHIEEEPDGTVHRHYRKKRGSQPPPEPVLPPGCEEDEDEDGSGDEDGDGDGEGGGNGAGGDGDGDGSGNGDGDGDGDGSGDGNGNGSGGNAGGADGNNNGLDILGRDCSNSDLPPHTGFQSEEAQCVNTAGGEVSAVDNNPSLLFTDFPDWVEVDEPFTLTISARNLVRDRFLGAGVGGYVIEASYLDENGITRGHVHVGCSLLRDGNVAPSPDALLDTAFFSAIEDEGGGAGVSNITVDVPGLPVPGMYRCQAWAGDASHRVPMMSFARQHIAADTVRITVTEDGGAGSE